MENINYSSFFFGLIGIICISIGLFSKELSKYGLIGLITSILIIILGGLFVGNVVSEQFVLDGLSYMDVQGPRSRHYDPIRIKNYTYCLILVTAVVTILGFFARVAILDKRSRVS